MRYENLVYYCNVSCKINNSNQEIINFNSFAGGEDSFIYENQIGLQDVSINLAGGGTKASLKIPLSENIVDKLNEESNPLYQALNLNNTWSMEYGWGGGMSKGSSAKISRMNVSNFGVEYDPQLRTYMLNIDIVPAYKLFLSKINLGLCVDTINKLSEYYDPKSGGGLLPGTKYNQFLSLSNIISTLLRDCRGIIKKINETRNSFTIEDLDIEPYYSEASDIITRQRLLLRDKNYYTYINPLTNEPETIPTEDLSSFKNKVENEGIGYFLPKDIQGITEKEIPDPDEDILVSLIGKTEQECRDLMFAMRNEAIPAEAQKVFVKMFDKDYAEKTNVYKFIFSLLEKSGYNLYQSPGILDEKTGEMAWLIIPLAYNSIGETYKSVEFRGLDNYVEVPPGERSIQTILGAQGSAFDLHSKSNVILSLQANTDSSQPSMASAAAAEALIRSDNYDIDEGPTMRKHVNSMYTLFIKNSKTLNITTIGLPKIRPFTTIEMKVAGKLFSGTYKVMSLSHSVGDTFTTTMELVQLIPGITPPSNIEDQGENVDVLDLDLPLRGEFGEVRRAFPAEFRMNTDLPDNT